MTDELAGPWRSKAWASRGESLPSACAVDLISDRANRWNVDGEPTVYLSGDPALALIEAGRHPDDLEDRARLIEAEVRIALAVDLRDPDVRRSLDLPDDPFWILDRARTRAAAQALRHSGVCDALLVPSVGALDQPERWNLVVFADDRGALAAMVTVVGEVGSIVSGAPAG